MRTKIFDVDFSDKSTPWRKLRKKLRSEEMNEIASLAPRSYLESQHKVETCSEWLSVASAIMAPTRSQSNWIGYLQEAMNLVWLMERHRSSNAKGKANLPLLASTMENSIRLERKLKKHIKRETGTLTLNEQANIICLMHQFSGQHLREGSHISWLCSLA